MHNALNSRRTRLIMRVSLLNVLFLTASLKVLVAGASHGQGLEKIRIDIELRNESLPAAFKKIESKTALLFAYPNSGIHQYPTVNLPAGSYTVKEVLDSVLAGSPFRYWQKNNHVIIFVDEPGDTDVPPAPEEAPAPPPITAPRLTVSGQITDGSTGDPLPGVNILIKGTTDGTSSDAQGHFSLSVDDQDVLIFSFIGFKTVEVPVSGRSVVDVSLDTDVQALETITITTNYYELDKRTNPGSMSSIGADVIGQQPTITNGLAAVAGRMPGVFVQQTTGVPGGQFKIQIRGKNSLREDGNEPLYVIDGVPFSTESVSSGTYNTVGIIDGGVSALTSINPADIETMTVLKDADATAIYGTRGANGVVLITTKKGKVGKTKIDVNFSTAASKVRLLPVLNTDQYLAMRLEAFANEGLTPSANRNDNTGANGRGYAPDLTLWDRNRYTDWQKVLVGGTAHTTSLQTSVSGGTEATQFMVSGGYFRQSSVFPGNFAFTKLSTHISLNHRPHNSPFSLSLSINGTLDNNNQPQEDLSASKSRGIAPNAPALYDANNDLNWENSTWWNPMADLERKYDGKVSSFVSSLTVGYELMPGLRLQTRAGINRMASREVSLLPSTWFDPALGFGAERSAVNWSTGNTQSWIIEPQLSWDKKIHDGGQLSAMVGGSVQQQHHDLLAYSYWNFPSNALLHDVSAATNRSVWDYNTSEYKYAAAFGRLNYTYKDKYIVNLTGRRDGSSRFGPNRKYANFGAIGVAWIFTEERLFQQILPVLNFGKLRGSYGTTGNDQIGNYQYLDTYTTPSGTRTQYQGVTALDPERLFNPDYSWEENKKLEGALELGLFENSAMMLTVGYYRNVSSNQLVSYSLPRTTGFSGVLANLGATVENKGLEIELTTNNLSQSELQWTTSFNVTVPRNKLLEFPNLDSSSYANIYVIGRSIYAQKLYTYMGVNPATGLYMVRDYNEDGQISQPADNRNAVFIGQDFYGGLNNSIQYKGWSLDVFFQYVRQTGFANQFIPGYINLNMPTSVLDQKQWRQPGDQAEIQRYATEYDKEALQAYERFNQSDGVVTDASFIRLKTLSLSWQVPNHWLKGASCRAFVQGQNLFVITGYKGYDPETQTRNLPPLRTLTAGVNFSF